MATPNEILEAKRFLESLDNIDWALLSGSKMAEAHKLTNEVAELLKTVSLYRAVVMSAEAMDIGTAGITALGNIRQELSGCLLSIRRFVDSNPTAADQNVGSARSSIITTCKNVGTHLAPYFALAKLQELRDQFAQLSNIDGLRESLMRDHADYQALREDSQRLYETLQSRLTQAAVLSQSDRFEQAAATFKKDANKAALWAVIFAGAILIAVGWSIFWSSGPPLREGAWSDAANLSHFSARALFVTVLSFFMVVVVKNYRAAKHNEVMNEHRARALRTFDDFNEGSEGKGVHEVILLHAAHAIFSVQASGYGSADLAGSTHAGELVRLGRSETGS